MLEITPCLDERLLASCCKKCDVPYSPAFYLYLARDRGEQLAAGLFEVQSDRVRIRFYECAQGEGHFLFDAVLRAGLNYAANQGISQGYIPESFRARHREYFDRLNFPTGTLFDITNFFAKYKSCNLGNPGAG